MALRAVALYIVVSELPYSKCIDTEKQTLLPFSDCKRSEGGRELLKWHSNWTLSIVLLKYSTLGLGRFGHLFCLRSISRKGKNQLDALYKADLH
jgi:hypothetical protein